MGDHAIKSESEVKLMEEVYEMVAEATMIEIKRLEMRILALEKAMIDVKHTNTDDGTRHRNDAGWFD